MKKCPKCGGDNSLDSVTCQGCQTPLDVASTQPKGPAMPQSGRPRLSDQFVAGLSNPSRADNANQQTQQMPVGPLTGSVGEFNPQQTAYNPPPTPYYRRQELPPPTPVRESNPGSWVGLIILAVIIAIGGIFYWNNSHQPNTALGIVRKLCRASDVGDTETVKKCLTQDTVIDETNKFSLVSTIATTKHSEFQGFISGDGRKYHLDVVSENPSAAKVTLKLTPAAVDEVMRKSQRNSFLVNPAVKQKTTEILREFLTQGVTFVCRNENGVWKVDGPQTDVMFKEVLRQMITKIIYQSTGSMPPPGLLEGMGFPPPPAQGGRTPNVAPVAPPMPTPVMPR